MCKKYELLDDVILITDYKLMIALENLTKEQLQIILLSNIIRKGKNWYVTIDKCIITVNAS